MIDFLLNGQPRHCAASPDTSVLELLRDSLGQTGTKEGCASGDCGACTVAIGEAGPDGTVRFHSANACITPAHQLQGRVLATVEGRPGAMPCIPPRRPWSSATAASAASAPRAS